MILVLVVHVVAALGCFWWGGRLGRRSLLIGALGPASALVLLISRAIRGNLDLVEQLGWAPAIGLNLDFRLDGFSALMVLLIGGVGVLVFGYSWFYIHGRVGLFSGYLVIFAGAMFGLVTSDNLLLLFVFWELTSVMSYLLIGFDDESATARASALQALLVTGLGGLAMLAGMVLLAQAGGTYSLSELLSNPPTGGTVGVGLALILVGAFAKSAQVPFHFWLPGAMSAPTPVSAYLHSATMVKAGIYLVARLAPAYALLVPWWRPTLAAVALTTMVLGGWRALWQFDLKLLLAQGTVSQLGFIMLLVGWGSPGLTFAGMAMILAHGLFKGALFMIAGIIDHQTHTRDVRRLSGVGRRMPSILVMAAVSVAAMAGVPPLLGFLSKEAALESLVADAPRSVTGMVVLGSTLTVAYGLRLLWGAFAVKSDVADPVGDANPPSRGFLAPVGLLVGLTIVGGLWPWLPDGLVAGAAAAVDPSASGFHLVLWHGFGPPIVLSLMALMVGWVVWRRPPSRTKAITGRFPHASGVYAAGLAGVNRLADRTTSILQNGSLAVYLGVILLVAMGAPGVLMAIHWRDLPGFVLAESPMQVVTAALVIGAALGTIAARRRLGAVLFLGAVGYGVAVLFVIQGAPDLALTQLLVETLALALFVLVLSRLPDRFDLQQTRVRRVTGGVVALVSGLAAMGFAMWAVSGRVAPSIAPEFLARSKPDGGGANVVNVILTDFRALDTLGEITVLAVAAMGVVALIRARLPEDAAEFEATGDEDAPATKVET